VRWSILVPVLAFAAGGSCDSGLQPVDTDSGAEETVIGILVSPEKVVLPLGTEVQLTATGLLEGRVSRDLTAVATWSSSRPEVAEVQNGLDKEGVVVGRSIGEAKLRAGIDGVYSPEVTISVTDATVLGVTVEPKEVALEVGGSVQLKAIAAYSDGSRADAAGQVRWITNDAAVAQLARGGKLEAVGIGDALVSCVLNEHQPPPIPVKVVAAAKPDLAISEVRTEGAGGVISMRVTVENRGTVGASEVWVDAFVDPPATPELHDLGDDFAYVEYVGPGDSETVAFTFLASEGPHAVVAWVDIDALVEESNEGNNAFSGNVDVAGEQAAGPNLTVDYFDFLVDSDVIYYVVDVANHGTDDVGEFFVDVYLDQDVAPVVPSDGDDYFTVASLVAGGVTTSDFLFERGCDACRSWILVDSYDDVAETDETDNTAGPVVVTTP
jgi:hypothetical protein